MRVLTFDTESISGSALRGRIDVSEQELTVVAVHDSESGRYTSYTREELPQLWPLIERQQKFGREIARRRGLAVSFG